MRRLVARLLGFGALVTLAACASDSSTNTGPASVAGTYTLRTINGSPLPYTLFDFGGDKYEITAGAITLGAGGTWTQSGADRMTEGASVVTSTFTATGTYTLAGNVITLVSPGTGIVSGSVDSGRMSLTQDGVIEVFTK